MPKHTGKRKSPIERKATHHQEFIGSAAPERAEAEAVKQEHVAAAREQDVVHEMAEKLEEVAAKPELRIPRSVEEGKRMFEDGSEMLREKAQERLDGMARPAQKVLELGTAALSMLFAPARLGLRLVMGAVEIPAAIFHVLRRKEA
ncbi:MAG TPA: hypothetical protein VH083_11980 [Myxococcales bacterium]|jgi:hypothetical protein|nr:hypothetical protein [Myxococcales bacterium]